MKKGSIPMALAILCTATGVATAAITGQPGGAFNLRIVSDSVPDWSSRDNFVASALSRWQTAEERALAQSRWMHRCRRVGNCAREDGRPVLDPALFFNSYGITFCSMISEMNIALWEAWGRPGRCVNLPGHVVSEVFYDDAWHMFDSDFSNYFRNERGVVASAAELGASRIHGNIEDLRPGEFYIFDHCPTASAPRGHIFQGPNSWWLIDVARDWYPGPEHIKPRTEVTGAHAGHRYVLGLRPGESYTRHWRALGVGAPFARLFPDGKDPEGDGSPLRNSRANGLWVWRPDLADAGVLFDSANVTCGEGGIRLREAGKPGFAVLRVMAANIVTAAECEIVAEGEPRLLFSGDGGLAWRAAALTVEESGGALARVTEPVAGRLEYLVKIELDKGCVLKGLTLRTTTQVNPRALPALRLGRNEIAAVSDEHLEYMTFNPRLANGQFSNEVTRASGWQSLTAPRDWEPSIRAVGPAQLVLRAVAPRDIRHIRMACTAHLAEPSADLEMALHDGREWRKLKTFPFVGSPYDRRCAVETRELPAGTREVLMRISMDGGGLVNVFTEAGYEPAGGFMPYDITYCWSEWRAGQWTERRHLERVGEAYRKYSINVGGDRPPRMNWVRVEPAGQGAAGYADGNAASVAAPHAAYRLVYGENISLGCPYTLSRPPGAAFPDRGGRLKNMPPDRLLTDGFIGEGSVWKLANINLTGPRNDSRVGELVVWEPGEAVTVTVDLGRVRRVQGARIAALQPNARVLFPAVMSVETSVDGRQFTAGGVARWDDCFFPPGDLLLWEGADSPIYEALPAGGMLCYRFPIVFDRPAEARYVRFRLDPPTDPRAGIGLYEVDVWDRIEKLPWDERLALPPAPAPAN